MFVSRSMTSKVITIQAHDTILEAQKKMATHQIRHLPVIDADDRSRFRHSVSLNDRHPNSGPEILKLFIQSGSSHHNRPKSPAKDLMNFPKLPDSSQQAVTF